MVAFTLNVNQKKYDINAKTDTPLLFVLRNNLRLTGSKLGCGLEQCGACAVLIDGQSTLSCVVAASTLVEKNIVTIEGLSDGDNLSLVQKAFLTESAAQCGYCTPGMIIATTSLFNQTSNPTKKDIKAALSNHLCRCGSHARILSAIEELRKRNPANG